MARRHWPTARPQVNQLQLLNSTVSLNIDNVQFTFGEQSAWLGSGESGSFLMSNNAPPFPMFRIDDVQPHEIPGLSRILGPFRTEFFIGQLSGHHWETCIVATCKPIPDTQPLSVRRLFRSPLSREGR